LFHDISDRPSDLTAGLGITLGRNEFEASIRYLAKYYTPVDLSAVLANRKAKYARPPVLVTFDDAYASVAETAAPILKRYGIPALFFVNASLIGNHDLALDNLICYATNTRGLGIVNTIAAELPNFTCPRVGSLHELLIKYVAAMSMQTRAVFRERLVEICGI